MNNELRVTVADKGGRVMLRQSFKDGDDALEKLCIHLEERTLEERAKSERAGCTRLWKLELRATNGKRINLDCHFVSDEWWSERRRLKGRHD